MQIQHVPFSYDLILMMSTLEKRCCQRAQDDSSHSDKTSVLPQLSS